MVEHPLMVICVNHNVLTTNPPRKAVEMRDLVRPILLSTLLRDRNPADHFDRIRCPSCWVDHDQLQTEMHQAHEPSLNTVKTQDLRSSNTFTKTQSALGSMKFHPPIRHQTCLVLLPKATAIPLDRPSILCPIFPSLKLHKFLFRSLDHCISPIAARRWAHLLRRAKVPRHTTRKQTTSRQSWRRQTVNEACTTRKVLSLPVTRFPSASRGTLPTNMTCVNTRSPRSRISMKTLTAVGLNR